jgi:hypothetical protein
MMHVVHQKGKLVPQMLMLACDQGYDKCLHQEEGIPEA